MLHKSKLFLKSNGSTILTCISAVGVVATTILAVKATPKAVRLLDDAKEKKGEELSNLEVVKVVAPVYIPTITVGISTIACMFGANTLNKRQQASIMSAYALVNSSYKEYKNKVLDLLGEDVNDEIQAEIAKDKYEETEIVVSEGKELFYDAFSGRYFESTLYKVQQAEYYLNRDLVMRDYIYLNEWYDYLEIEHVDGGWDIGWCGSICYEMYWQMWIDFNHKKTTMDDGLECTIVSFWHEPVPVVEFEDYF